MFGPTRGILFLFVKSMIESMKRAFCFDLDGTLTEQEILPEIARNVGIHEEIDILTKITMQGLMTFDKSMKLRVKLLSVIPVSEVNKIVSKIIINPHLQKFIQDNRENCFIITGNLDVWVDSFIKENFGCGYFSSNATVEGDKLIDISKILHKSTAVNAVREQYDTIVAVGDGMNDCSMFEASDLSIAYGGVHPPVPTLIKLSDYVCYDAKSLVNLLHSLNQYTHEG
jgi:phosphoserine phosphatase